MAERAFLGARHYRQEPVEPPRRRRRGPVTEPTSKLAGLHTP